MFLQLDAQNYITGYAVVGTISDGIEVPDSVLDQIDPAKVGYYTYIDGVITLDQTKYNAHAVKVAKDEIRERRANECFPIINRGKPWYDNWTTQQYQELHTWYVAWLNAPATGTIPTKPSFLVNDPVNN